MRYMRMIPSVSICRLTFLDRACGKSLLNDKDMGNKNEMYVNCLNIGAGHVSGRWKGKEVREETV